MIAVIPFTSKILEPCQNSLAYQPPNPWTMGLWKEWLQYFQDLLGIVLGILYRPKKRPELPEYILGIVQLNCVKLDSAASFEV
ncbi:hypothetical protein LOK49_LG09G00816 [Camellia lanceoleosa]|uniref:Uncharacterized protein n=1 Tax=Camellia lanceoleosa TaxID=1840588 RepID=A0ACC0GDR3_9ERIC|nr:hypothetical protein LOK49_LG09G00816 [Camellia lanceoleosa]